MTPFHVPYVFIPVSPSSQRALVSHADIVDADSMHPARLDSWHGEHSGRIVCRLYLETPVAMGLVETRKSDKDRNRAAKVVPGKRWFDTVEDYFLPGNTLRGMVAHIAETLTQSNLRVLDNKHLSIKLNNDEVKELGHVHSYFAQISPDVLPLGSEGRTSDALSVADQLFGYVTVRDGKNKGKATIALASRLRFSDARLSHPVNRTVLPECTLKVLNTPKTNSHSMYYHHGNDATAFIEKGTLNPAQHRPNGRKFYLHATADMVRNQSWMYSLKDHPEAKRHLHIQTTPFETGQSFEFHIDFDNLTDQELSLIATCLRPAENFRHKLGLGKPIGLGSVRIDNLGVFLIDRERRYSRDGLGSSRYASVKYDQFSAHVLEDTPFYADEKSALDTVPSSVMASEANSLIDDKASSLVRLAGQWPYPEREQARVIGYPFVTDSTGKPVDSGYEWFVQNEHVDKQQMLGGLEDAETLPELYSYIASQSE